MLYLSRHGHGDDKVDMKFKSIKRVVALFLYIGLASIPISIATAKEAVKLPDFSLSPFTNAESQLSLGDIDGKVVYLDFWASWCIPCRKTFPFMNALQDKHESDDFVVIAINMDEDPTDAGPFLEKYYAEFSIYREESNNLAKALSLPGLPTAYVIDKKGYIRGTYIGFREKQKKQAEALIETLILQGASQE